MININNSYSQRGVALLFALGVLSLLLVMGVAFLGNALISQKIAINSQEASSAKSLARTAVDRALAHLTLFQLMQSREINNHYFSDASSVFSRMSTDTIAVSSDSTKRDLLYYTDADAAKKSRLSISRGKEGNKKWYDGSKSLAEWVYVHADGTFSNGQGSGAGGGGADPAADAGAKRIVGRFAYQVLPQTSKSRLSLLAVTSGATREVGKNLVSGATARIPQKHHWGVEVDELVIPDIEENKTFATFWKFGISELCAPLHEFDNFVNVFSGKVGDSASNPLYNDNEKSENYKRWLEYIFAEGRGRIAKEAYWGGKGWYPRFNLGEFKHYWDFGNSKKVPVWNTSDTWYQRFLELDSPPKDAKDETKEIHGVKGDSDKKGISNSDKVVVLLSGGVKTDGDDPSSLQNYTESFHFDGQYDVLGIPFLRRIGNNSSNSSDKISFEKIANLRKQIAANLNDYCDADSIPTSDKPADTWGTLVDTTAENALPSYTGNEKTPYINEIGFEFKLDDSTLKIENGNCIFTPKLKAKIISELIGVYKGLQISNAELHGKLRSLKVTLSVEIKGKAEVSYVSGGQAAPENKKVDFSEVIESSEFGFTFNGDNNGDNNVIGKDYKTAGSGYWIGSSDDLQSDNSVDLTDKLKAKIAPGLSVDAADVTLKSLEGAEIKIEAKNIKFELGNLALRWKDIETESDKRAFVDFVIVSPGERVISPSASDVIKVFSGSDGWVTAENLESETGKGKGFFYLGSMQAVDPRQNLFAKLDPLKENDWINVFKPTFTVNRDAEGNISSAIGQKNICSDPSAPKYADANQTEIESEARDKETATDPAWKGDNAGEHISTAVIRNAPMRSPWELGFIHRGIPFQTINLKKAGGFGDSNALAENAHDPKNFKEWSSSGTQYQNGDAGILDQIKMTEFAKSYGKIDFSALRNSPNNWIGTDGTFLDNLKLQLFKSLFENLKSHEPFLFVDKVKDWDKDPQFASEEEKDLSFNCEKSDLDALPETKLRSRILANDYFASKFGKTTDAASEEFIGKTINLIEGEGCSLPNVFKIVVVAQTILDSNGPVAKLNSSGTLQEKDAEFGKFDANIAANGDLDTNLYFDDILSEARVLVTVEKLHYMEEGHLRARLRVKQIEYLD